MRPIGPLLMLRTEQVQDALRTEMQRIQDTALQKISLRAAAGVTSRTSKPLPVLKRSVPPTQTTRTAPIARTARERELLENAKVMRAKAAWLKRYGNL